MAESRQCELPLLALSRRRPNQFFLHLSPGRLLVPADQFAPAVKRRDQVCLPNYVGKQWKPAAFIVDMEYRRPTLRSRVCHKGFERGVVSGNDTRGWSSRLKKGSCARWLLCEIQYLVPGIIDARNVV